jgi:hypothetical protein
VAQQSYQAPDESWSSLTVSSLGNKIQQELQPYPAVTVMVRLVRQLVVLLLLGTRVVATVDAVNA